MTKSPIRMCPIIYCFIKVVIWIQDLVELGAFIILSKIISFTWLLQRACLFLWSWSFPNWCYLQYTLWWELSWYNMYLSLFNKSEEAEIDTSNHFWRSIEGGSKVTCEQVMRQVLHIIWNNESITLFLQTFLKNKSYLVLPLNNLICNLIVLCFTLKKCIICYARMG